MKNKEKFSIFGYHRYAGIDDFIAIRSGKVKTLKFLIHSAFWSNHGGTENPITEDPIKHLHMTLEDEKYHQKGNFQTENLADIARLFSHYSVNYHPHELDGEYIIAFYRPNTTPDTYTNIIAIGRPENQKSANHSKFTLMKMLLNEAKINPDNHPRRWKED